VDETLESVQTEHGAPIDATGIINDSEPIKNSMSEPVTPLTRFFEGRADSGWSVQVVNRTDPEPMRNMLQNLFDGLSTDMSEKQLSGTDDDIVLLLRDGEVVETSPLEDLKDGLLMVNGDFYRTGTEPLENVDPPDIIMELSGTIFQLRGFPASDTEKLVLILMSRYIESLARKNGAGTLRTSFQRLSRLHDESGTWRVYQKLGETEGLGTHVYGIPDWTPPADAGLSVHGVTAEAIKENWFVIHRQPHGSGAAMLALTTGNNEWKGFWTFDEDEIQAIDDCIQQEF